MGCVIGSRFGSTASVESRRCSSTSGTAAALGAPIVTATPDGRRPLRRKGGGPQLSDGSLFPSGGTHDPTLTTMATALREHDAVGIDKVHCTYPTRRSRR